MAGRGTVGRASGGFAGRVACVREGSAASALDCSDRGGADWRARRWTGAGGGRAQGSARSATARCRARRQAVPLARPPPREGGDGRAVGHPGLAGHSPARAHPARCPARSQMGPLFLPRATPCTVLLPQVRSNTTAYYCLMRPGQRRLLAWHTGKTSSSETDRSRLPHVHPRTAIGFDICFRLSRPNCNSTSLRQC